MKARFTFLIFIAAALAGLLLLADRGKEKRAHPTPRAVSAAGEGLAGLSESSEEIDSLSVSTTEESIDTGASRSPVAPELSRPLRGAVISDEGSPIGGALVSIGFVPKGIEEVELLDESISETDGSFELSTNGVRSGLRIVWVTKVGFNATCSLIQPDSNTDTINITLERAEPIAVLVLDVDGEPVTGAIVHHSLPLGEILGGATTSNVQLQKRAFRRSAVTEASGVALLSPVSGIQQLQASDDRLLSLPWLGPYQPSVRLNLLEGIQASGRVLSSPEISGEVLVEGILGGVSCPLGRVSVQRSRWGPVKLPVDVDEYQFTLISNGYQIEREGVAAGGAAPLRVDFEGIPAFDLWYLVVDENENPLPDASVLLRWEDEDPLELIGRPMENGFIRFDRCRPGTISVLASCPGYGTSVLKPEAVPPPERTTSQIQLFPAASLTVLCERNGEPVSEYRVVLWPSDNPEAARTFSINSRDGKGLVSDVEMGTVGVLAHDGYGAQSEARTVVLKSGPSSNVQLQLPRLAPGVGRVLNAETGEAIADATVVLRAHGADGSVARIGEEVHSDFNGDFLLPTVGLSFSRCQVNAPGYLAIDVTGISHSESVDFGEVRLWPQKDLLVELHSEESLDFTAYTLEVDGPVTLAAQPFPSDGKLRIKELVAGEYWLGVRQPSGVTQGSWIYLLPGTVWTKKFTVSGETTANVRIEPGDVVETLEGCTLKANYTLGLGANYSLSVHLTDKDEFTLSGIQGEQLKLLVTGPLGEPLAASHQTIVPGKDLTVVLPLRGNGCLLRVVDDKGHALSGVRVNLFNPGMIRDSLYSLVTDESGACRLRGLRTKEVMVALSHPKHGTRPGLLITLSDEPDHEVEVSLDVDGLSHALFRTADGPISGLVVYLTDSFGKLVSSKRTGGDGIVGWENLESGAYRLNTIDPKFFALRDHPIQASPDATLEVVTLRRLGDLEFAVHNSDGILVNGAAVDFRDLATGELVSDLIARGHLREASLITDTNGLVKLVRLPEGRYQWEASAPVTLSGEGELSLMHGRDNRVDVWLRP